MRCFNHPDRDAIGLCKSCCKGLCHECTSDLGHGLACKGKHEANVEAAHAIIQRSARVQGAVSRNRFAAPALYAFMGLVFSGYALGRGEGVTSFLFVMGAGFLVYSIVVLLANSRAFGPGSAQQATPADRP